VGVDAGVSVGVVGGSVSVGMRADAEGAGVGVSAETGGNVCISGEGREKGREGREGREGTGMGDSGTDPSLPLVLGVSLPSESAVEAVGG